MNIGKKLFLSLMVVVLIAGISHSAFAAGNAGNRVIKKLVHPDKTRVLVVPDIQDWLNPDGCDASNQVVLASGELANDGIYREMFAMLLSAYVAERRVELRTNGCLGVNGTSYPVITQITLL